MRHYSIFTTNVENPQVAKESEVINTCVFDGKETKERVLRAAAILAMSNPNVAVFCGFTLGKLIAEFRNGQQIDISRRGAFGVLNER